MNFLNLLKEILYTAAAMTWSIFWALMLGFIISGLIMAFVPKGRLTNILGKAGPKEIFLATFFGALSSSCSYAAASMSRSLFQKGAHIVSALAFLLASTNLVLELSLVLWVMLGWQFVLAEFFGGIILIFFMSIFMKILAPLEKFEERRVKLQEENVLTDEPGNPRTRDGWILASQEFIMELKMIWQDIVLGLLISAVIMVLVPQNFWQKLFLTESSSWFKIFENALIGPIVSLLSFVCSVGNIPLAQTLYHGGISFGGTISFIFADLIIIPLILIYKKYYGWRLALWITGIFYASMVLAGLTVELLFSYLNLIPIPTVEMSPMTSVGFIKVNYTFWLNSLSSLLLFISWVNLKHLKAIAVGIR
jgi:uncharacterized membrane protein YraQ (UPF0718 family)